MSETVVDLLDQIVNEFGLDITQAQALRALNQRHRRMVVRSECLTETVDIGVTVAGTDVYDVPASVTAIRELSVNSIGWERRGRRVIRDMHDDRVVLTDDGTSRGLYGEQYTSVGGAQVWLWPVPTQSALVISALAVVKPTDLLISDGASAIKIPDEYNEDLVAGTIGALLARTDERLADAASFTAQYENATAELKAQIRRRLRSGPTQMRVSGYQV